MRNSKRNGGLSVEGCGSLTRFDLDIGMSPIDDDVRGGAKMKPASRKLNPEEVHRIALRIVSEMRPRPKGPMLVCRDGEVVVEVDVDVSPRDPNWRGEEVRVRR
jgi:hypothetical protein